jgi:large subunit ribosomal protein L18
MAHGPIYKVTLKRRRSGKTNYYKRRELLKSDEFRLVIRRSNNNMLVQIVESRPNGDHTLLSVNTRHLIKYDWKITGGNIPGSYLLGYLAGKKGLALDIDYAILDLGVQTSQAGSRIYATLKGIIDSGLEIPASDHIFPEEDIIKGSHIAKYSKNLKSENKDEYKKKYTGYLSVKQAPEDIEKHFEATLNAINKEFS